MLIISIDTDGIYLDSDIDTKKLNDFIDRKTKEIFNIDKNYLHVDKDDFDSAYFRTTRGKHYILKEGNKIIFHGQSFKGSHMPNFFDKILEEVARSVLENKPIPKYNIRDFPITDLIQSIKVKAESDYKTDSSLSMQLIIAAKREMPDIKLTDNDQLSYIRTNKGYELILPGKIYGEIEWKYYEEIVKKIYERLQADKSQITFNTSKPYIEEQQKTEIKGKQLTWNISSL